jgi:hypothetical protein
MKVYDILFWEIIPARHAKYVYMMAGAFDGGVIFAVSESWGWAIFCDIATAFTCWAALKIAEPLVASAFRFLFD